MGFGQRRTGSSMAYTNVLSPYGILAEYQRVIISKD